MGIAERFARCIEDPRAPDQIRHGLADPNAARSIKLIRFRALAIAAGYPDANGCDLLRRDPAFKMAVGRVLEDWLQSLLAAAPDTAEESARHGRYQAHDGSHG